MKTIDNIHMNRYMTKLISPSSKTPLEGEYKRFSMSNDANIAKVIDENNFILTP
jgi:hypothetical protein